LQRGASLARILELVGQLRRDIDTPIILFGYYNPIFHYGPGRLAADAKSAGVDGLLVVDLPPEEADELWRPARSAGLDVIFLLAPTSDAKRVGAVLKKASGFVYYVSMTGVTGSRAIEATDVRRAIGEIRDRCRLPIGVGFGINSAAAARDVAGFADAVIVGSAIMQMVEAQSGASHLVESVGAFIRELKGATRKPAPAAA
jgi:tryptophan synthase alpha chain